MKLFHTAIKHNPSLQRPQIPDWLEMTIFTPSKHGQACAPTSGGFRRMLQHCSAVKFQKCLHLCGCGLMMTKLNFFRVKLSFNQCVQWNSYLPCVLIPPPLCFLFHQTERRSVADVKGGFANSASSPMRQYPSAHPHPPLPSFMHTQPFRRTMSLPKLLNL